MKNSNSKKLPTKEFQKNSSNTAWMFLQELKQEGCEISTTGHIYPKGKKHSVTTILTIPSRMSRAISG